MILQAILGGTLIGLGASVAWLGARRIAGVSGLVGALFRTSGELRFPLGFLLGLLAVGAVARAAGLLSVPDTLDVASSTLVVGGLLVGFGTQLGSGCTSGHGVCGISRLSLRSLVATGIFMVTGMLVATAVARPVSTGVLP